MLGNITIDHEAERKKDISKILDSKHLRKIVVAGPGTGKSYIFEQAIKKKRLEGKTNFLAITFVGKLKDSLADDLAGLATTMTLHGFARKFVLEKCPDGWEYYPKISSIIMEDLNINGINNSTIGDKNYEERTKYYRAIGDEDIMQYAVKICKNNSDEIPKFDLILIDEFQDFNEVEAELVDLLATKNEVLVVGDDDQALYEFKGSFAKYIRERFDKSNSLYESHTLKYCSRCTEIAIKAFHDVITYFSNKGKLNGRIKNKDYLFYPPDKQNDSDLNPYILIINDLAPGLIPFKIKNELQDMLKKQKVKTVLIIGEGRTCKTQLARIARQLNEYGFNNIKYGGDFENVYTFKQHIVNGYKILAKGKNPLLAWRLLSEELKNEEKIKYIQSTFNARVNPVECIPADFKVVHETHAKTLNNILGKPKSTRDQIADSSIEKLINIVLSEEQTRRELFTNQLIKEYIHLGSPLSNINITVCNILGSKGLGADAVFLIGFDEKKLPMKDIPEDSEIYQLLVALTRAKKRIYLINTKGKKISQFINCFTPQTYKIIN